jgi:hypothetical protein
MEKLQLIGGLGTIVMAILGMWGIFVKAGRPGWQSLVPIYNGVVFCQVCGVSGWFFLLMFIPLLNLLGWIYLASQLSAKFGKGIGTTLGLIFIGIIFLPLLGWGDAQYQGAPAPAAGS